MKNTKTSQATKEIEKRLNDKDNVGKAKNTVGDVIIYTLIAVAMLATIVGVLWVGDYIKL